MKHKNESQYNVATNTLLNENHQNEEIENKKSKKLRPLFVFFGFSFFMYLLISVVSTWLQSRVIVDLLVKSSDFFLMIASVLISVISMKVGNKYNDRIAKLLNNIVGQNSPLKFISEDISLESVTPSKLPGVLSDIDMGLTIVLFVINTILQIADLVITESVEWLTLTIDINTIAIDILAVLLSVLSIIDCKKLSDSYENNIKNIETINQRIFEEYNRLYVDGFISK